MRQAGCVRAPGLTVAFGQTCTAIRLQAAGIQTALLEKRDKLGGHAYVYEDDGFIFDAGPR